MKKIGIIIGMIILIAAGLIFWNNTQESIEGYVYSSKDSALWVIEIEAEEVEDGKDLTKLLEAKAANSEGIIFEEAFLNKVTNTFSFKKGEKVKVFWPGGAFQSAPSLVEDTFFIVK
ncbi:DUF3221 domain-containing protein [Planococcus ruber]|uniref:DUF3221 domain-containing protein n=1 Tax=Planococcus ruber TaxID=2027871 RepID=UPI001FF01551|nr:DUF3221 domain-containing protein [Planococcus ruber]MCJ1908996.1 DUF3221 domain-containing protein [Planococcus ruber]